MPNLGSLLGLVPNRAGAGAFGQASAALGQLGNIGATYGNEAQQQGAAFNQANQGYQSQLGNYEQLLGSNPFSSAFDTQQLAQASGGMNNAYQTANANAEARNAQNGLGAGSSSLAGSLNANNIAQAGQLSGLQNQLAMNRIQANYQRQGQLTNLMGDVANQAYGRTNQALGSQAGIEGQQASAYQNIGQAQFANQQAQNNQLFGGLGAIAGDIGNLYGMQHNPYSQMLSGGGSGGGNGMSDGSSNGYGYGFTSLFGATPNNPIATTQYASPAGPAY